MDISISFVTFASKRNIADMIQSMTGYGKASAEFQGKKIVAEIKSLNSKSLDLSTRISSIYREKEMEVRSLIAAELERGKVDFALWFEKDDATTATPINKGVLEAYHQQIMKICEECNIEEPGQQWMSTLLRLPDVMTKVDVVELSEDEWAVAQEVVKEAIAKLVAFRQQEGAALQKKFMEKLGNIGALLKQLEGYEKLRVEKIRQRIVEGLQAIPGVEYDKNRLEQEMIYYIEKLDINEEKQRLTNHLKYFEDTMNEGRGQGKKLGFIAQEMGREINTTGSKSNLAEMQNLVVMMKDELEQIKEQVLNVM